MKIYTFRIIRDSEETAYYDQNDMSQKYPLYAWTKKKNVAKRFMLQRDMKRFININIHKDRGEEFDKWAKSHHGYKLDYYDVETYINRNTDEQDVQFAEVVATDSEMVMLDEVVESGSILADLVEDYIPLEIFSPEVQEAMDAIGFKDAMMMKMMQMPMGPPSIAKPGELNMKETVYDKIGYIENLDVNRIDARVTIDQLAAFVRLYKDILSEDFGEMIDIKAESK